MEFSSQRVKKKLNNETKNILKRFKKDQSQKSFAKRIMLENVLKTKESIIQRTL